ncbi:hypothetical protein [Streptomyces luteireticuli]|uniref:hypothetical protein n=1 Tax=Streptomyces luteireticuli TaxID=173858 RepID=UPI003556AE9C
MEKPMVPRFGVTIDLALREPSFVLIGVLLGALGLWAGAPQGADALMAILVSVRASIRRQPGRRS